MGLLTTSTVNASSVKIGADGLLQITGTSASSTAAVGSAAASLTSSTSSAIAASAGGLKTTTGSISGANALTAVSGTAKVVTGPVSTLSSTLTSTLTKTSAQLSSAISSVTNTFGSSLNSLASGINGTLSGIFKDTNVATASTVTTKVSDPLSANLTSSATPVSSLFTITPISDGSTAAKFTGASSVLGTKSGDMIGTDLQTVLNRYDLDASISSATLSNKLSSTFTDQNVGKLFSDPTKLSSITKTITTSLNTVSSTVKAVKNTVAQTENLIARTTQQLTNDIQVFVGKTTGLASAIGQDPLKFVTTSDKSLYNTSTGAIVSGSSSTADVTTANGLLSLARDIGCLPANGLEYASNTVTNSIYSLLTTLSALSDLPDLLGDLLSCSRASTLGGQSALSTAFTTVAGTNISAASSILGSIENTASLNTVETRSTILSNTALTYNDIPTVQNVLSSMGTNIDTSISIDELWGGDIVMYDTDEIESMSASFTNGYFGDPSFSIDLDDNATTLSSVGTFILA